MEVSCGVGVGGMFRVATNFRAGVQSTVLEVMNRFRGQSGQRRFLLSFCATRAFTSFLTSAAGSGLSVGKWMVPLDFAKPLNSFLNSSITDAVGNKLQWFEHAANHTSGPFYFNSCIPDLS